MRDKGKREKRKKGKGERSVFENSFSDVSDSDFQRGKFSFSLLLLFSLSLLIIVIPLAYSLNIWVDEASTLYTTEQGIFQAFQNVFHDEKQAPLYFLILSLWRELNGSIFFARLFSIICAIVAIKVFNDLAQKTLDKRTAIFATAFFALHPFLMWTSLEIRLYSMVVLLAGLLLKFFDKIYLSNENKANGAIFIVISIIALYTNYFLGFLLAGFFLTLLVLRKWSAAKDYFLKMLIVGACILPLIWAVKIQVGAYTSKFDEAKSIVTGAQIFWNHFLTFVLPTEIYPLEDLTTISTFRVWLVRILLFGFILFLVKFRKKVFSERLVNYGVLTATVFAFFGLTYFLVGVKFIALRHFAVVFPVIVLLQFTLLSKIFSLLFDGQSDFRKISEIVLTVFVGAFFVYSILMLYPFQVKRGDWARVGKFIQQIERPNQPIIVFTAFDALALPYHYKGINKILPDRRFFDWEWEDAPGKPTSLQAQTEFTISKIPPEADEIWLLTNEKCVVKDSCLPLEKFVEANYTIVEEREFYLEKVRLLRRKK
jgi:uncharacterized membrane protein